MNELHDRQLSAWQRGDRLSVKVLVSGLAPVQTDSELLELVYAEFVLRAEFDEKCEVDEYVRRFPQLR